MEAHGRAGRTSGELLVSEVVSWERQVAPGLSVPLLFLFLLL